MIYERGCHAALVMRTSLPPAVKHKTYLYCLLIQLVVAYAANELYVWGGKLLEGLRRRLDEQFDVSENRVPLCSVYTLHRGQGSQGSALFKRPEVEVGVPQVLA